jgi:hypothetical protein
MSKFTEWGVGPDGLMRPMRGGGWVEKFAADELCSEIYEALKTAEWGGNRSERVCPVCRRLDFEEHRKDCLLANALAKAKGKPTLSPAPDQPATRQEP